VRSRERGAALLLVLAAVVLLTVLAVELASRASADSLRATRASRDAAFRRQFDSGAEIARGLIVEPGQEKFTTWGQSWNRDLRFTLTAGQEAVLRTADENGKINIARAISHPDEAFFIRSMLSRLFDHLARHNRQDLRNVKEMEEKIMRRLAGREPLLSLDGLRETGLELSGVFGTEGLSRFLTCFGDGRINLNTAPKPVLAALDPEFDDAMVDRISNFRGKGEGEPGRYRPFEEPQDLMLVEGVVNRSVGADGQLRVTRNLYEKVQGFITVKRSCFSARIEATADGRRREAWAFLKPDGSRVAFEELLP
jgi:hypothetical protein